MVDGEAVCDTDDASDNDAVGERVAATDAEQVGVAVGVADAELIGVGVSVLENVSVCGPEADEVLDCIEVDAAEDVVLNDCVGLAVADVDPV